MEPVSIESYLVELHPKIDRVAASVETPKGKALAQKLSKARFGPEGMGELAKLARNATHPMTSFVLQQQARDFSLAKKQWTYLDAKGQRLDLPPELVVMLEEGISSPTSNLKALDARAMKLWQTYGEIWWSWIDDPTAPLGVSWFLSSPLAVTRGTNPATKLPAMGIKLASWMANRWFDIRVDPETNTEVCATRRAWNPDSEWEDKPHSSIRAINHLYELYWQLHMGDVTRALSMAANNGLLWFYSEDGGGFADGGFDGMADMLDSAFDDTELPSPAQATKQTPEQIAAAEMSKMIDLLGSRSKHYRETLKTDDPVDMYVDVIDAIWRDPDSALQRMPLPFGSEKAPQYIPVGRAYDAETMMKQDANNLAIANGLEVPASFALGYISKAPQVDAVASLRQSAQYWRTLRATAVDLDGAFVESVVKPWLAMVPSLSRYINGLRIDRVLEEEDITRSRAIEDEAKLLEQSRHVEDNTRWAWEQGFPVDVDWAAAVLGLVIDKGVRLNPNSRLAASAASQITGNTRRAIGGIIDMPANAAALFDRR